MTAAVSRLWVGAINLNNAIKITTAKLELDVPTHNLQSYAGKISTQYLVFFVWVELINYFIFLIFFLEQVYLNEKEWNEM